MHNISLHTFLAGLPNTKFEEVFAKDALSLLTIRIESGSRQPGTYSFGRLLSLARFQIAMPTVVQAAKEDAIANISGVASASLKQLLETKRLYQKVPI